MRRNRRADRTAEFNVWPAFTDVLGGLVVVLVFLITVFVIGEVLIGREFTSKDNAIGQLSKLVEYLEGLVGDTEQENKRLNTRIALLKSTIGDNEKDLETAQSQLAAQRLARAAAEQDLASTRDALDEQQTVSEASRQEVNLLTSQTQALREELARLTNALTSTSEQLNTVRGEAGALREQAASTDQQVLDLQTQLVQRDLALAVQSAKVDNQRDRIAEMDKVIKARLLDRVEELERYTSDFFGRLRDVFADNPDIKIVGDRFVFQSEVLFPSGQSHVSPQGRKDLSKFITVFQQLQSRIPKDLPVIIEVQGHTDKVPISTARYKSNWELSVFRALDVVNYLISQGIPPHRLAAVGMGEYHPIDARDTAAARRRNRRIELKITSR